jgi:uncharacterized protein (DUF1499 family)
MKRSYTRAAAALLGLLAGLGVLTGSGAIDHVYAGLFGPPAVEPIDFATLTRRSSPNDALVCPPDLCTRAAVDIAPPEYPVSAERLRAIVAEVAAEEPRTLAWSNSPAGESDQDRYVARSRLMRFPDAVEVRIIPRGENRSTLALYSRSEIGYWDFGVNRARLERWLERIGALVAEAPPVSEG